MKKRIRGIIAVVCASALMAQVLPASAAGRKGEEEAQGISQQAVETPAQQNGEGSEPEIVGEDTSRRTETEKHFRMSDGTYVAAMYDMPVHYRDEEGEYREIDNTLEEAGEEYGTKAGPQEVKLSKKASSKKLVTVKRDGYTISWGFEGASKAKVEIGEEKEKAKGKFSLEKVSSEAWYRGIYEGVDLQYIVMPDGVKENVVLRDAGTQRRFVMTYTVGKLKAEEVDSRTIALRDGEETVFTITAPEMSDAGGAVSDKVSLKLLSEKNGKLRIEVSGDSAWLDEEGREYPVTLDPITWTKKDISTIKDKYLQNKVYNFGWAGSIMLGWQGDAGDLRGAVKFTSLPTLNSGDMVYAARMYLQQGFIHYADSMEIDAYEMTAEWSGFNQSGQGVYSTNDPVHGGVVLDYLTASTATDKKVVSWDITSCVKKWYANAADNHGIFLKCPTRPTGYVQFASRNNVLDYAPYMIVSYVNNKGLEEYWDYTAQDLGTSGTTYVLSLIHI